MVSYAQKQKYRITLEVEVLDDPDFAFDPFQIDWSNVLCLEPAEDCTAYVEDLSRDLQEVW